MAQDLFSRLAQQTLAELSPASQAPQEAGDDPVSAILQVAQERGIDPAHLLGLAKLETQAGRKTVKGDGADTRNLFNVKDFSKDGAGIRARDNAEGSNDRYRQYGSYRESVEDLASLLERRYPGAAKASTPEEFARELKRGGYATDPAYERKLASTIRSGGAARSPDRPQEWDQGARYAPVGLAPRGVEDSRPAEKPSKSAGFWEGAADVGLSTAQGVVGSVKALTDLAGSDNAVSRGLDDASKGLEKFKSDASQQDRQYHQQQIKAAEASGDWKTEVAAYANMVWDMPLESLAQGVGSFATLGAGKVAQMAKLASAAKKAGVAKEAFLKTAQGIEAAKKAGDLGMKVNVGLGVGQGIGGVKGSQYEQTYNAAKESGLSEQQAQTLATEAQSYQQGWGQQALGAGLGYVAGKTGPIEKLAAGKTVGAGGVARRFVGGGLVEAGTEGLQGGQERYAGNAAAIDAGVMDPSKQWAGVAGSGASEAITAGILGGGAGALGRPDVDPQAQAKAAAQKSGGIVSRAGLAATPGAQQPSPAAPNPAATQPTAAAAPGASGQSAAGTAAGSAAAATTTGNAAAASPAQPAQTPIQASAMSAIEQALEADKQRRRAAGEVVEDEVEESDVVAAGDPAAVDPPEVFTPPAMQVQPTQPAQPASAGFSLPAFDSSPIPKMDPAAADEQRRQFAEFEQKRKNRRAGTRASAWERNPFMAFLGANGLNRDTAGEFAPGLTERRKAFVPGYGPVFRPGAKNLDELVQTAREDGFLRDDDGEPELYDLIDRALRGERIAPLYADGAAEAEGERRLREMQERESATFDDYLAQQEADPLDLTGEPDYDERDLAEIGSADVTVQNEVAALQQQYADLGFDPADVLESLATQTENLPDQAYYDLAKSRFIQLLDQAYGQAEPQAEQGGDRAVRLDTGPQSDAQADGGAAGSQAAPVTPPAAPIAASLKRADAIRAKLDGLKSQGFSQFTRSGGRTLLINPGTYETVELTPAEMAVAKAASGQARAGLQSLRGQRKPAQVDQRGADVLQSYSPADVLTQEEQAGQQQAAEQAERDKVQAQARADDERKRIEQASHAAADSFELGQNPLDSLTGQKDIFGAAPADVGSTAKDMRETQAYWDGLHQRADKLDDPAVKDAQSKFESGEIEAPEFDAAIAAAEQRSTRVAQDLAGERINAEWTAFDPQSGTLGIPRAEMPQIKAEHRGAMVNFLKARGIDGQQETIPATAIKPTQAEFSPAKVKKAMDRQGGNRSIIVSADGYVVDGHHQWLAAREKGEPIQAIRLDQNIGDVLAALKDMPSAQPDSAGNEPADTYEQRNADRVASAKAADTQEAWDAITAEENADPERHFEGTDALRRAINGRRLELKPDNGSFAIYPDRQQDAEPAATDSPYPLVTHTTAKGKVLRGYIVQGMTLDEVKANIDPYALKKDGGVFVREQHKAKLPKPAAGSSGRGPAASQTWKNEGKSPADLIAEKAQSAGRELAVQVAEESREQDFRPSEIPQAVEQWAADARVPTDDLKRVLLQELPSLGVSEARIQQIRVALYPVLKPAASRQPAAAPAQQDSQTAAGQQWDAMTNAERVTIALEAGLPPAAARKWSTRALANIDAKVRDKLAAAMDARQAQDNAVYELPVDERVFADALGELIDQDDGNQDDGEAERYQATFNPDVQRISLPRVTAASPKPAGVEFLPQAEANQVVQSWKDEAARQGKQPSSGNYTRTVISLFDASGVMSRPWEEAGYNVIRYDIQNGDDINDFNAEMLLERHGDDNIWAVIAQPPCTDFASSGAQWWAEKDAKGLTEISNELVRQTMRTLELFRPPVWWLENPVGRMQKLNGLPDPVLSFDPWHFGDPWTKRTSYWGNFNPKVPTAMVEPIEGSKVHKLSSSAKFERSLTPEGVAYAMFMANNANGMSVSQRLTHQYPGIDAKLFERALAIGQTEQDITESIEDSYYENDLEAVREILMQGGQQDLAQPNDSPVSTEGMTQAEAQQALEAGQKLLHYDEEIWLDRAKTDAVDSYVIKSRYTDLPVISTKGPTGPRGVQWGKQEAAKRAVEFLGLPAERAPDQAADEAIKDFIDGKRDTAPMLEEVQAETAKSPLEKVEAELADWKRRRALPTNQAQVGVIDEEIAKLEAQVKAMREFEGQNDELDGKMQGYERKADEQALRMRIRELKRKIEQIPESIDVSGDFSVGRLETNTLGIAGDGWYVLDKNGKKASGQYRTKAEAERLRSTLVSSNPEREALIKELEAAVDALAAMRDTQNTASKQPAITADPDLEAIFDQLDGITQRTQAAGQQAAAAHPQAERIQFVQKHILDILEDLEGSGKVTINC